LRGEGALIVDKSGHRFMLDHHPDGELAPRDVVARAVHEARVSARGAFLDCRKAIGEAFQERFPTVFAACLAAGIDPARKVIPIAPAAHYHMGGVHVDGVGRSTLDGLWCCGEVACTGAHGANRLASNSLLEAVVFAARVAEDIQGLLPKHRVSRWQASSDDAPPTGAESDDDLVRRLRHTMGRHVGVVRDRAGLAAALTIIGQLLERAHTPATRNALIAAQLIASAALARQESRGGHYRSDFPAQDPVFAHRRFVTLDTINAEDGRAAPLELAS